MLFDPVEMAPKDPILGLTEAFAADPRAGKINLSVGVYQDENGRTPVLASVKRAEERLLRNETTKNYMPIDGRPEFALHVQRLLLGGEAVGSLGAATSQTPGGTAALRVAADLVKKLFPQATVWLSRPTWPNHPSVFAAAGLAQKTYPYFKSETRGLDFEGMLAALDQAATGDVVLLHGCCHNPTGVDPTPDQWKQIAELLRVRQLLPLVDLAYQGFAEGLEEDAVAVRAVCETGSEALIASSFSKNFGLYRERVGALTLLAGSSDAAARVQSQVKQVIRANYSNPPSHGAATVSTILDDAELRALWTQELAAMRERIADMRQQFADRLQAKGAGDFSFITRQRGMFSFSGLTPEQVDRLRDQYGIYIVGSGRINVAGMTPANIEPLCTAIAEVMG